MGTAVLVVVDIALVLLVARALGGVLRRVRQPPVMAEVLAGIVLGASFVGALPGDPTRALFPDDVRSVLTVLGSIAVVGYLFGVGARLDVRALRAETPTVLAVAAASFILPFAGGAAVALALHDSVAGDPPLLAFALFTGTAFGVTAVPVLARIVDARGLDDRPSGRIALAAAGAQELLVWPALALAIALGGPASGGGANFALGVLRGAGAVVLVLALARLAVPRAPERLLGPAALVALGISAAVTELGGLHLVVGAFLFGVALPAGPRETALALLRRRAPAVAGAALLPLFFALPALRVDLASLGAGGLGLLALVLAVAVATKVTGAVLAARRAGVAHEDSLTIGALMNARGLVELVVLGVGLEAGLIDVRWFSAFVLMALVTTFATGPAVDRIGRRRHLRRALSPADASGAEDRRGRPVWEPCCCCLGPAAPASTSASGS